MKIGLLSDVVFSGGAQRVARDVGAGLAGRHHNVRFLSEYDGKPMPGGGGLHYTPIPYTKMWHRARFGPPRPVRRALTFFLSRSWDYILASRRLRTDDVDVWNVHNIHGRRMPVWFPFRLSRTKPVIWTFHDMWPITGGCIYAGASQGFLKNCRICTCEFAVNAEKQGFARAGFALRRSLWKFQHDITIVSPSKWLRDEVGRSASAGHVRVEVIPNGIDISLYRPLDRATCRRKHGIPVDAYVALILAGQANEPRKGLDSAAAIAAEAMRRQKKLIFVVAGRSADSVVDAFPERCIALPYSNEQQTIVEYYNVADLFLSPSLAENFPLTILEAMACGVPVVTFGCGGIPEQIVDGQTGFCVPVGDRTAAVSAILSILDDAAVHARLSSAARQHVEQEFTLEIMIDRYEKLMHGLGRR